MVVNIPNSFDKENPSKGDLLRIYNDPNVYSRSFDLLKGYSDPIDRIRMHTLIDIILKSEVNSILDNGCGCAVIARDLAIRGYEVTGFDISYVLLDKVPKTKNLKLVSGDSEGLPFGDSSFDCIICSEVLEHIKDNRPAIREMVRVVKNDGMVLITIPNMAGYDSLDGRFGVVTNPIRVVNFFLRIIGQSEIYKYGYSTHFHKLFPWEWGEILSSAGLEIVYDRPVFISPWLPDIIEFIDRFIYGLPGVLGLKIWFDDRVCGLWPFKYLGQCHLYVCKPRARKNDAPKAS